jgi:rhodanese-related sulfurtransferase
MKLGLMRVCSVVGVLLCGGCLPEEMLPITYAPEQVYLDVRTPEAFAADHVNAAINLSCDEIEAKAPTLIRDKSIEIYVDGRGGQRAEKAIKTLKALGYPHVYVLP